MAHKRLEIELMQLKRKPSQEFSVGPVSDSNLFLWKAYLAGPQDTPYQGGTFEMEMKFPTDYPFKPPKTKFITKIFHPNISDEGDICVDILQDDWSPAMTAGTLLLSISSLMANPNPYDPLSREAAALYNSNIDRYNEVAREYTQRYANK